MVLPVGFEPTTLGFRDRSSAAELKAAHGKQTETPGPRVQTETHCNAVQLNARPGEGVAWVKALTSRFYT